MSGCMALVVEDSRTQANAITQMLAKEDWTAIIAWSLQDALRIEEAPTLALLDLNLGDGCGIEALPLFRERFPGTPIAAMTTGAARLREASRSGCDYLLKKPFDPIALRGVLSDAAAISEGAAPAPFVMVADDSATIRKAVSRLLEQEGLRPAVFEDAETLLAHVEWDRPDAVILDIFMPGLGGIEGLRRLRQLRPGLPLVAMSGGYGDALGSGDALKAAGRIGADAVLKKPFDRAGLADALARAGLDLSCPA